MNDESSNEGRPMPLNPHRGKLIETVVIKYPDFACWILDNLHAEGYVWLRLYVNALIDRFDAKPFVAAACAGKREGAPCTHPVIALMKH